MEANWVSMLANVIGLIGVAMVLLAYFLLQIDRWCKNSLSYSVVNLVGSILIPFSLMVHFNLASVIIEVVWISVSSYGVWRALLRGGSVS